MIDLQMFKNNTHCGTRGEVSGGSGGTWGGGQEFPGPVKLCHKTKTNQQINKQRIARLKKRNVGILSDVLTAGTKSLPCYFIFPMM